MQFVFACTRIPHAGAVGVAKMWRSREVGNMSCECLEKCPFFNDTMHTMPGMSELLKTRFCHGDFTCCARYRVFKAVGREQVPHDLFPTQVNRVDAAIAAATV